MIQYNHNDKKDTVLVFSPCIGNTTLKTLNKDFNVVQILEEWTWFVNTDIELLKKYNAKYHVGISMGGHGAILHAYHLQPKAVLAFNPQQSINPASKCKTIYNKPTCKHHNDSGVLELPLNNTTQYTVIHGLNEWDIIAAQYFKPKDNLNIICLPYEEHQMHTWMSQDERIKLLNKYIN